MYSRMHPVTESLSPEDAVLLYAEAPGTQLQIGALCFLEDAPLRDATGRLRIETLRAHVSQRLAALPRFRQRIVTVPGDVATPRWVDDEQFDLARHVRHVRLPGDGGDDELRHLMGRLLSEPMDTAHPLWDLHVVEGRLRGADEHGRPVDVVAVIVRAHHVMADGLALYAAATLLLDPEPSHPVERRRTWRAAPTPGPAALVGEALADRARRQLGALAGVTAEALDPRRAAANLRLAASLAAGAPRGVLDLAASLRHPPAGRRAGPVGRHRSFAWSSLSMPDMVEAKRACGATLNDVVLAVVAGALRRMAERAGTFDPGAPPPRAIVPVGGHPGLDPAMGNRFAATTVELPVQVDDPLERVRLLHERVHGVDTDGGSVGTRWLPHVFALCELVPPPLLRAAIPPVLAHQPLADLAVSNIPGSRAPLYLFESPMLGLHPFIDVVGNVGLIVGVLSYRDRLGVGVTVDPDLAAEPDSIIELLDDAADELLAAVRTRA
jgi:WS/DGAT/MGAT family acyltransferase